MTAQDRIRRHAQVAARCPAPREASRPSRWSSSPSQTAARCASRARWAARSTARSARPAQQGFNRNLTTAEIVGQVWLANRELGREPDGDRIITNVVLMGMGEPLANFRNVVPAIASHARRSRLRPLAAARDALDLRPRAADLQPRRGVQRRARRVAARAERRAAQPARADQPQAPDRRAARGLLALPRAAERPQRHVRVRDARRRQRPARARARARAAPARSSRPRSTSSRSILFRARNTAARPPRRSGGSATCSCREASSRPCARRAATTSMRPAASSRGQVIDRTQVRLGSKLVSLSVRA